MKEPRDPVEAINECVRAIEAAHAELVKVVESVAKDINRIWREVSNTESSR